MEISLSGSSNQDLNCFNPNYYERYHAKVESATDFRKLFSILTELSITKPLLKVRIEKHPW